MIQNLKNFIRHGKQARTNQQNGNDAESAIIPIQDVGSTLRALPPTALPADIESALRHLAVGMNDSGMDEDSVIQHVTEDLERGFARGQSGPRYFGFVTGGSLPAAQFGDILATGYDQNVQVHLPTETIATALEHRTLEMVLDLLSIPRDTFPGRSLTTGATASNILGLACARDAVIRKALQDPSYSVSQHGFPTHSRLTKITILTDRHHASIEKAAAVVGIGYNAIRDIYTVPVEVAAEMTFTDRLRKIMEGRKREDDVDGREAFIVVMSAGEVNTGDFTVADMKKVRKICDEYGAWLHIDAAFGALACLLPEYAHLSADLALADSLTTDGHKWFNVPYSCGIFFTRDLPLLKSILSGPFTPSYLSSSSHQPPPDLAWTSNISSPLHTNLENSRRFIALPLYCALLNQGREGYAEIVARNVKFARDLGAWMEGEGRAWYQCLNIRELKDGSKAVPLNIVLFRARDVEGVPGRYRWDNHEGVEGTANARLVMDINAGKEIYVSPGFSKDMSCQAVRIAVSNWVTGWNDGGEDLERTKAALRNVMTVGDQHE